MHAHEYTRNFYSFLLLFLLLEIHKDRGFEMNGMCVQACWWVLLLRFMEFFVVLNDLHAALGQGPYLIHGLLIKFSNWLLTFPLKFGYYLNGWDSKQIKLNPSKIFVNFSFVTNIFWLHEIELNYKFIVFLAHCSCIRQPKYIDGSTHSQTK